MTARRRRDKGGGGRWLPALTVILPLTAAAAATFELHLETLTGEDWGVRSLALSLEPETGQLRVRAGSLALPAPVGEVRNVDLRCRAFFWQGNILRCEEGVVEAESRLLTAPVRGINLSLDLARRSAVVEIAELPIAAGRAALHAERTGNDWSISISFAGLSPAGMQSLAADLGFDAKLPPAAGGRLDGRITAGGTNDGIDHGELRLRSAAVNLADDAGELAAEDLSFELVITIEGPWQSAGLRGELGFTGGALYVDPLLLEVLPGRPIVLSWRGRLSAKHLELAEFAYEHPGAGLLKGALSWSLDPASLSSAAVKLAGGELGKFYETYLQPFLYATALGDLSAGGRMEGAVVLDGNGLERLQLQIDGADLIDSGERFSLRGLHGKVEWHRGTAQTSKLRWANAEIYRIPLGGSTLELLSDGDSFRLPSGLRVPLLSGFLEIDDLSAVGVGSDNGRWALRGRLDGISMDELSKTLGWVGVSGELSGEIPTAVYSDGRLELGGILSVQALGGEISISGLEIEELLGLVPRLRASIELHGLDLEKVTRTFSFGKIEGPLSGYVRDLELVSWAPVRFDAALATPEVTSARRQISQRAIESISSLGGGSGGAALISKGVLSVFKKFPYRRLGIKCRLQAGVCEMDGVAEAPGGYYLVEGGGLPRIDVIGYERRVDWNVLLNRIQAATESSTPVIE